MQSIYVQLDSRDVKVKSTDNLGQGLEATGICLSVVNFKAFVLAIISMPRIVRSETYMY